MRLFPTGVALLTTGSGENASAMTLNSLVSVSLSPPRVLIGVQRSSRTHAVLTREGSFSLNLLAAHQGPLARLFSSRDKPGGADLELYVERHHLHGRPCDVLPGGLAALGCDVEAVFDADDHDLLLGRVRVRVPGASGADPLVFHRGHLGGTVRHG
ncbi:monooxygenase [Actinorhabdospora filicis]|uniref:Monooxygenase n=2 Tax=Actinorhabdospora filicis TaxID=1785913 RepID=A0A9W6SMN9_9ACTN|nr:monooxygenase [Actinorhabdospora filicis]